jgi:N-acetyl-1-D-myo-inositol-2-amino-2-deoxy-alpha-D-glucopyranoside deacetylase
LVVTAHPDDEALIAGGTLAACAAAGVHTGVICLTRGEEGPISGPELATRETLPDIRVRELDAACAELGVSFVRCYAYPDSYLPWSDVNKIVRGLAQLIARRRPEAVITFGEDGLYWHHDHIATLDCTRRALGRLSTPPPLYRAAFPSTLMSELVAELHRRSLPADIWSIPPEDFGDEDVERAIELDVRPFVERKLRALRSHRTQIGPEHAFGSIPADLADRYLGTEWFVTDDPSGWLQRAVARGFE